MVRMEAVHRRSPAGQAVHLRGDARRTVLNDEVVSVMVELTAAEWRDTAAIVIEETGPAGTRDVVRVGVSGPPGPAVRRDLRLSTGSFSVRCRLDRARGRPRFGEPLFVDVREAPKILTLMSMGGASLLPPPPIPDGPRDAQTNLEVAEVQVDRDACRRRGIDPTLIRTLTTNRNIQCNDLDDTDCVNFIEHLARRLQEDGLLDQLDCLTGSGLQELDTFETGLRNLVVLGKWENSEREQLRPPGILTWEYILTRYRDTGGHQVILLGQSQGGAKFAEMVKNHWKWDNDLEIALFVSWDATSLFGGIDDVGPRPQKVLGFFQTAQDAVHWQTGNSIAQATEEHDLTDLFSHNAIARSEFVHDKTATFIRDTIRQIRNRRRSGNGTTFRRTPEGGLGESVELTSVLPRPSVAQALPVGPLPVLFLVGHDRRSRTVRISDQGLLGETISERTLSADVTAATCWSWGGFTYLALLREFGKGVIILRIEPGGGIAAQVPSGPPGIGGTLFGTTWQHLAAVRVGTARFLCLVSESGDATVYRIGDDGKIGPVAGTRDLGRSSAVVGYDIGGQGYLAAFGDEISVFRLGTDGSVGPPIWQEASSSPLAMTTVLRAAHAKVGNAHHIVLSDVNGRVWIRPIRADGTIGPTIDSRQAGTVGRQTAVTCFEVGAAGYVHLLRLG